MSRFRFETASTADNESLLAFAGQAQMPGPLRLCMDRSPDYFASQQPEGEQTQVLLCRAKETGQVIATGHRAMRTCWVNGAVTKIGFLGGLRIAQPYRGGTLLCRGYEALKELHSDGQVAFYLTTILEGNRKALTLLRSGRCRMPHYVDLGRLICRAIPCKHYRTAHTSDLRVSRASVSDIQPVTEFLQREGPRHQFFPRLVQDSAHNGNNLPHDLNWSDFHLAWSGSKLVGIAAAWDQSRFRRWRVTGYAPWLAMLRPALNLAASITGRPTLPQPGSSPSCLHLAFACMHENKPDIFRQLISSVLSEAHNIHDYLVASLHERDPLASVLLKYNGVPLDSRLHAVAWDDGLAAIHSIDKALVPHLESGSL